MAAEPGVVEAIRHDIAWLSSAEREGRSVGSAGLAAAGAFIEDRFDRLGLLPAGDGAGFRQAVPWGGEALPSDRSAAGAGRAGDPLALFNVVARLDPGIAPLDQRVVLLGAHYDHLGRSSNDFGGIYPGADDNASGVAVMLEVARLLAGERDRLARSVIFVGFTGEEAGLLGATRFVRTPPAAVGRRRILVMLNLDMVGRPRRQRLEIAGASATDGWSGEIEAACAAGGLRCAEVENSVGPSDHVPFLLAGTPVLYLSTGAHPQYHRRDDTLGHLDLAGCSRVATVVAELVTRLAARREPLAVRRVGPPADTARRPLTSPGGGGN